MPMLPGPVRAAVGLAATALEQARSLPERAIELPMLAVSTALQLSLRAQQRYAQLAAKGDDVLNGRPTTEEPPPWATFDPPVDSPDADPSGLGPIVAAVDDGGGAGAREDDPADGDGLDDDARAKPVRARRDTKPSRFDAVGDEP